MAGARARQPGATTTLRACTAVVAAIHAGASRRLFEPSPLTPWLPALVPAFSGFFARKPLRRRANDLTDRRAVADMQFDLAAEFELALHDRARADDDARRLAAVEPAARLVDEKAALDARAGADVDVAGDGFDAAADVRGVEVDRAVDVRELAGDVAAAADADAAVDRFDLALDAHAFADPDAAVDRADRLHTRAVADLDRAIDRFDVLGARVVADADRTVDGVEVADRTAVLDTDAAVDLADVVVGERCGRGEQAAEQGGDEDGAHGGLLGAGCVGALMRRLEKGFRGWEPRVRGEVRGLENR